VKNFNWDRTWFGAELVGLVLGVLDFFKVVHVLFAAQAVIAIGFGFLLVHATHQIETAEAVAS